MRHLTWLPGALLVLAVPLLLVCASVAWAVNDLGLYQQGFQKYQISDYTGIAEGDLRQVGADIRRYFNSTEEPLAVRTRIFGREQALFNTREAQHMADVKRLIWGVYAVGTVSGLFLAGMACQGLRRRGRSYWLRLARLGLRGGALTLLLLLAIGLFSLVAFDTLFLLFHQISFANDLWQLNPATDYLVALFPQGFWFDATLRVATLAVAGAVALTLAAAVGLLYHRQVNVNDAADIPPATGAG
ncbi:MAG: TIGR01906 family membrane protein [Dehalococcoidia bacterium]|nr:TIGR01906 family membrane protein [Dehalococcoidia bacterium]MSQ17925.1 TIGR01906 family membrane protein [Dehalococcoidia bacterium]